MPLYEYNCKDCGTRFDVLRPIKEADEVIQCRNCHSTNTQRALSLFFAKNAHGSLAGTSPGGCAGCSGGTCSSCGNH